MIQEEAFVRIFSSSFWKKSTKETLIEYEKHELPIKPAFLKELYFEVKHKKFTPNSPRNYVVFNKHNLVSRIVPCFHFRENCLYYFCVERIQENIAKNRVEGTYGGWTLNNPIKSREVEEISRLTSTVSGIPFGTYTPYEWSEHWKDFQKRAFEWASDGDLQYFLKFDIANFYDSINLNLLEAKIRHTVEKEQMFYVDLLFHFLHNWNRPIEGYYRKTVGLPQDEVGDSSRILSNFYLQDFDLYMKKICDENCSKYIRYSDDQIIMSQDAETAKKILFLASRELHKIGLNINSSKVEQFTRDEYMQYWAFETFADLHDPENKLKINNGVETYFTRSNEGRKFRSDAVLKRILSIGLGKIETFPRYKILSELMNPEFLMNQDFWVFSRIATSIPERNDLFASLDSLVEKVNFNSFLYNLLKFNKKFRPEFDNSLILKRIEETAILLLES